jgi:bifunctional non-homologous end joining protein LigD
VADRYTAKRDFTATPEPSEMRRHVRADGERRRFLLQRHRARRLHYDLRLEIEGGLESWAVPKGPTLDADVKRLAVHVEEHPFDYGWFEGVIPSGYGQGDVIVWDDGWWEPDPPTLDDAAIRKKLAKGELTFRLHGRKIEGDFVIVQTRGGDDWLLMHRKRDGSVPGWDAEDHPRSVLSGRTNEEVEERKPARWDPPTADELAALDALGVKGTWTVGGVDIALTNLDKVLFPKSDGGPAVTKRDVVRHYAALAGWMAPYLANRPVNLRRFPDGIGAKGFWQKAVPDHAPHWLRRWPNLLADPGETRDYLLVDGAPALAWAANHGAVEIHPWTSTAADSQEPSYALIDIDPGEKTTWEDTLLLARLYRTALDHLGVVARPKVSGQRGIQIWVPIEPNHTFAESHAFVESLSHAVGAVVPELVSWKWLKDERKGLARLDHTQNAINKTLVAPFSLRAAPGAPVSVPIEWDELDDPELRPDRWTIGDIGERLRTAGDPFLAIVGVRQALPQL